MMNEEQFYEWFSQVNADETLIEKLYEWYEQAAKFVALYNNGVDNWPGYGDAMQELYEGKDE